MYKRQVLSRSQFVELGYFNSTSRVNARLQVLAKVGYLRVLSTPFFGQHLYSAGPKAKDIVGDRIADLLSVRTPSPQLVQHSMAVTSLRIHLCQSGGANWRFEPQVTQAFIWKGRRFEVRPDGFITQAGVPTFIECTLGHVSLPKFESKLESFRAFHQSGALSAAYATENHQILTVTTSTVRKMRLRKLADCLGVPFEIQTFADLGISLPGGWS